MCKFSSAVFRNFKNQALPIIFGFILECYIIIWIVTVSIFCVILWLHETNSEIIKRKVSDKNSGRNLPLFKLICISILFPFKANQKAAKLGIITAKPPKF